MTPQELAEWITENVSGCTYNERLLEDFGVDGEINLIELCDLINAKKKDGNSCQMKAQ